MGDLNWTPAYELDYWNSEPREFYIDKVDAKRRRFSWPDRQELAVDIGGGLYCGVLPWLNAKRRVLVDALAEHVREREGFCKGIEVLAGDFAELPLPDECADIVVAFEVWDHAQSAAHLLLGQIEALRILKRGGLLYIHHPLRVAPRLGHTVIVTEEEFVAPFERNGLQLRHREVDDMGAGERALYLQYRRPA